eukprot:CAMPEP_0183314214 /NCGR_PEP_ID=MMETSP0160_2-20130417/47768_1 /TAXON_ID=2839 ORGANISM="Odontella Sinensis, Strain Grunow 1884" /NCGR_SAMPLE_ID=MMETSP0160_2 /ASSEMBLY_ACC=CAM_ASM_000250 /LENGTH=31 /DNA_ID= /DNA_START= /DNA_END= /DNA_ORIENTATION=
MRVRGCAVALVAASAAISVGSAEGSSQQPSG